VGHPALVGRAPRLSDAPAPGEVMRLRAAVLRESGNGTRVSAAAAVTPAELLFSAGNYSAAAGAVLTVRPTGARLARTTRCIRAGPPLLGTGAALMLPAPLAPRAALARRRPTTVSRSGSVWQRRNCQSVTWLPASAEAQLPDACRADPQRPNTQCSG